MQQDYPLYNRIIKLLPQMCAFSGKRSGSTFDLYRLWRHSTIPSCCPLPSQRRVKIPWCFPLIFTLAPQASTRHQHFCLPALICRLIFLLEWLHALKGSITITEHQRHIWFLHKLTLGSQREEPAGTLHHLKTLPSWLCLCLWGFLQ